MATGRSNERNRSMWLSVARGVKSELPKHAVTRDPRPEVSIGAGDVNDEQLRLLYTDILRAEREEAARMRKSDSLYQF